MSMRVARRIIATLAVLDGVNRVEHLERGYSQDKKYVLWGPVHLGTFFGSAGSSFWSAAAGSSTLWHVIVGTACCVPSH